jgi:hypothetical protein
MIFVGDALFVEGNDYPVADDGVDSIPVRDPEETETIMKAFVASLAPLTRRDRRLHLQLDVICKRVFLAFLIR